MTFKIFLKIEKKITIGIFKNHYRLFECVFMPLFSICVNFNSQLLKFNNLSVFMKYFTKITVENSWQWGRMSSQKISLVTLPILFYSFQLKLHWSAKGPSFLPYLNQIFILRNKILSYGIYIEIVRCCTENAHRL